MKTVQLNHLEWCWCDLQGKLFELAWEMRYNMEEFIGLFMNSDIAARFDSVYDEVQWMCRERMMENVLRECRPVPQPRHDDVNTEALYWAGFLYRFWHIGTGETSREIHKIAPWSKMRYLYAGFHTLACEKAIDLIKEEYTEGKAA